MGPLESVAKMKKAQIEFKTVEIIAIIIGAAVFFGVVGVKVWELAKEKGTMTKCNFNLVVSALVKAGSMGFTEIPPGCEAEYVTVDSSTIDKTLRVAKKRITKYCGLALGEEPQYPGMAGATAAPSKFYEEAANEFCAQGQPTLDDMNEWALDRFMAKELADCADKVWHGKLDVFASWKVTQRVFCVVCSVVSFSDDLPVALRGEINSLYTWAQAEPYYSQTFYDYLSDWVTIKPDKDNFFKFIADPNMPVAVTYVQTKASWLRQGWFTGVAFGVGAILPIPYSGTVLAIAAASSGIGQKDDIKQLALFPYELLQKDPRDGGLGCTDIVA